MIASRTTGACLHVTRLELALFATVACISANIASAATALEERAEAIQAIRNAGGNLRPATEESQHAAAGNLFDPRRHFVDVYLAEIDPVGALLPMLAALPEVERLFLQQSNVADGDLMHLEKLSNLNYLSLERTSITDDGLATIAKLPKLETLRLDGTRINGLGLKTLAASKNLQQLSLDNTQVDDAALAHLASLRRLANLSLCETNVGNDGLRHLRNCRGLQMIGLRATLMNDAGVGHVAGLPKLGGLDLTNTIVGDAGLELLGGLHRFTRLDLASTKVSDASAARIGEAAHLISLDLRATSFTDVGLAELAGLSDLKTLRLDDTKVSDAGLRHLARMKRLEILGLGGSAISDAGLAQLKPLASLRQLLLNNTPISDDGLAALRDLPLLERVDMNGTRATRLDVLRVLPRTTENVRRILAALDEPAEFDFTDQPLSDVLDYLCDRHGIPIQVGRQSLDKAGVDLQKAAVTLNVAGVPLRQALEAMLKPLGLAMDVRHEVLFIGADPLPPIALELPVVSENERISPKLVQALGEKTKIDVTNQPISDVAAFLTDKHGITIRLGWPGLAQPELVGIRPVTRNVKGISLKSALELILSELDLSCVADGEQLVIVPRRPGVRPLPQRWEILYGDITLDGYAKHLDEQRIELGLVDAGKVTYVSGFSKSKPDVREGKSGDEKRLWLRWQKGEMKQADEELLRRAGVHGGDRPILQFYPDALEKKLLSLEHDYRGRDIAAICKTRFAVRKRGSELEFCVIGQEERAERK